jgi:hypothetical protein
LQAALVHRSGEGYANFYLLRDADISRSGPIPPQDHTLSKLIMTTAHRFQSYQVRIKGRETQQRSADAAKQFSRAI